MDKLLISPSLTRAMAGFYIVRGHIRQKGKKVEVVSFEHKPSYALIQKANVYHSIKKSDLKKFLPE